MLWFSILGRGGALPGLRADIFIVIFIFIFEHIKGVWAAWLGLPCFASAF